MTLNEHGFSVQQTSDDGYIIVGYTVGINVDDVYLVKTDGNGNEQVQTYEGTERDRGYSVQQTTDGGFI